MDAQQTAKLQRAASAGAVAVAIGVLVFWALVFAWFLAGVVSTGGVDWVHSFLIRLTTVVPALAIAAVHIALARQLGAAAKRNSTAAA